MLRRMAQYHASLSTVPLRCETPEFGKQQSGGAIALDRPDQVGGIEHRRVPDLERGIVQVGVLSQVQDPLADLEAPVRHRLRAGGEIGVVEDHLVLPVCSTRAASNRMLGSA